MTRRLAIAAIFFSPYLHQALPVYPAHPAYLMSPTLPEVEGAAATALVLEIILVFF